MIKLRTILSANVRTYGNEKGLSQTKLANLVGVTPNYIAMIESGKRFPTDKMLEKIAAALNQEPCELFTIAVSPKNMHEELLLEFAEFIELKLRNNQKHEKM